MRNDRFVSVFLVKRNQVYFSIAPSSHSVFAGFCYYVTFRARDNMLTLERHSAIPLRLTVFYVSLVSSETKVNSVCIFIFYSYFDADYFICTISFCRQMGKIRRSVVGDYTP